MNAGITLLKRASRLTTMKLLLCAFAICAILALPSQGMAATVGASPHGTGGATSWDSAYVTALVQKANPYVHVTNYHAVIDPALKTVVSPQDYAAVAAQVDRYNSEPLSERSLDVTTHEAAVSPAGCTYYAREVNNWYGPSVYTNECLTQAIKGAVIAVVAIATAFKNYVCPRLDNPEAVAACASIATAIQTIGGLTLASIQNADHGNGVWWNDVFNVPTITSA